MENKNGEWSVEKQRSALTGEEFTGMGFAYT